jgi:hypothetical protein
MFTGSTSTTLHETDEYRLVINRGTDPSNLILEMHMKHPQVLMAGKTTPEVVLGIQELMRCPTPSTLPACYGEVSVRKINNKLVINFLAPTLGTVCAAF